MKDFRPFYGLLPVALIFAIAATLRRFGTEGVSTPAAVLLSIAGVLSLWPMMKMFSRERFDKKSAGLLLSTIFLAHLVATLFFFPPEDILNDRPVLTLDHSLHYYQVTRAKDVFAETSRLHTYDPWFMAGYPGGVIFDIDSKGVEMWCSIMRFMDTARAFKLFILIAHLSLVFAMWSGARRLGFDLEETVYTLLLFLAFWHWGRPYAGHFRYAGMFSYIFVCHLTFLMTGLFRSFLRDGSNWRFFILGPLVFFIHPTAALILPVGFLTLFFLVRKEIKPGREHRKWEIRVLLKMAGWCLLVIAVNLIWLIPFFRYLDIKIPSETFFQINGPVALLALIARPGNIPAHLMIVLAVPGFIRLLKDNRRIEALTPAVMSIFLLTISSFGTRIPFFDQTEPGRFLLPAFVFMAPLSGSGLISLREMLKKSFRNQRLFGRLKAVALTVLLLSGPLLGMVSSRAYYRYTVSTSFTTEVEQLVEELRNHSHLPGRLMMEDGPAWRYGDCHLPSVIPLYTGIEQIGGPYPYAFIKHNFTTFQACRTMGYHLKEMDPVRLSGYLSLYDVRWILTATSDCRDYFSDSNLAEMIWKEGFFTLWEVRGLDSPGSDRSFTVDARYGEILLKPGEGLERLPERIILGYHWDRGLHVDPPAKISPINMFDDPVPLILIETAGERYVKIEYR
ncbi:MAG: hypothetical protein KOO63_10035 [Bacteroidales bacterium]|nr:hypothetical protein [Candidatus Latescibacterota bacterium]